MMNKCKDGKLKGDGMYSNVKYLGMSLEDWCSKVFNNTFSLGELYRLVTNGTDISKMAPSSLSSM